MVSPAGMCSSVQQKGALPDSLCGVLVSVQATNVLQDIRVWFTHCHPLMTLD
ncbi:hypothetical protein NTG1052_410059 [Candidatus Nitrotoga sp. 1052]|nr:hypothetical protein NTG1052_410059 [Candidatus Nitrotoga sp. 1052]